MTLQSVLDDLGIEYLESGHHHCRPGWIQIRGCPFCGSDSYHLGWNLQLNYASCWKCGGHHWFKVLQALGVPKEKARSLFSGIEVGEESISRERRQISLLEPKGRGPLQAPHRDYLLRRGFDPDRLVLVWELEGIGIAARLPWRIYIPIIQKGRRVSWTTRTIGSRVQPRYLSASAEEETVNHKEIVYGIDYCRHSVVIVEGPADAWRIGPGAGAVFGTAFSTAQVKALVEFPYRYICFDSSPDAQALACELAEQLSVFPGQTENIVLDAKDPGEASPKEIKRLRRVAKLR